MPVNQVASVCLLSTLFAANAVHSRGAQIVLPAGNTATEASADLLGPFANRDMTMQWVFASSELTGLLPGSTVTGIGLRLNAGQLDRPGIDVTYSSWELQLSPSANAAGSLDTTFAANVGPGAVTVRTGPLTIPAATLPGGAGPNPFHFIPFTTPYIYTGGDLLFTLRQDGTAGGPLFTVDAVRLSDLPGIADTVRAEDAIAATGQAHFFNVPVTALQFTPVPEPGASIVTSAGLLVLAMWARRRSER
jgi:hypothetical protein